MQPAHAAWPLWGLPHKGLRLALGELLARLGAADPSDGPAWADTLARLDATLAALLAHQRCESELLHAVLEARQPGACAAAIDAHQTLHGQLLALREQALAVARRPPAARAAAALDLYRALALQVAELWQHFEAEEANDAPQLDTDAAQWQRLAQAWCARLQAAGAMPGLHAAVTAAERRWLDQAAGPGTP